MKIILNGTVTMHCNLLTDVKIARETGYDGIEIIGKKLMVKGIGKLKLF